MNLPHEWQVAEVVCVPNLPEHSLKKHCKTLLEVHQHQGQHHGIDHCHEFHLSLQNCELFHLESLPFPDHFPPQTSPIFVNPLR